MKLEWILSDSHGAPSETSATPFGQYRIARHGNEYYAFAPDGTEIAVKAKPESAQAAAQADFDARLAKCIPAGWKLVPEEPTEEMIDAGDYAPTGNSWRESATNIYQAMLAAAPEYGEG